MQRAGIRAGRARGGAPRLEAGGGGGGGGGAAGRRRGATGSSAPADMLMAAIALQPAPPGASSARWRPALAPGLTSTRWPSLNFMLPEPGRCWSAGGAAASRETLLLSLLNLAAHCGAARPTAIAAQMACAEACRDRKGSPPCTMRAAAAAVLHRVPSPLFPLPIGPGIAGESLPPAMLTFYMTRLQASLPQRPRRHHKCNPPPPPLRCLVNSSLSTWRGDEEFV